MSSPRSAVPLLPHAVVLGGSIAGLITARALADAFERVTVVERGQLPDAPEPRREVPQAQHLHVVLRQGVETLNRLFPTLQADLERGGARRFDYGRGARVGVDDRFLASYDSDLWVHGSSRALFEWTLGRLVTAHPRVGFRTKVAATDLAFGPTGRVCGVMLDGVEQLDATLVVDASGRASRVPRWLRHRGLSEVREVVVDSRLTYASRLYDAKGNDAPWQLLMSMPRAPGVPRSGGIFVIEGGRWQVTLGAMDGDRIPDPDDDAGWLAFARSLPVAAIGQALTGARPLGPATSSRATANQIRRYEQMSDLPDGLVCVGDSVCALNPLYGQGISVAALGIVVLADELRRARSSGGDPLAGFSHRFQQRLAQTNRPIAALAISADAAWPHTRGLEALGRQGEFLRGRGGDWTRRYAERVLQVALVSPDVARAYMEVMHLVRPSSALVSPSMVWHALRHRFGSAPRLREGTEVSLGSE